MGCEISVQQEVNINLMDILFNLFYFFRNSNRVLACYINGLIKTKNETNQLLFTTSTNPVKKLQITSHKNDYFPSIHHIEGLLSSLLQGIGNSCY